MSFLERVHAHDAVFAATRQPRVAQGDAADGAHVARVGALAFARSGVPDFHCRIVRSWRRCQPHAFDQAGTEVNMRACLPDTTRRESPQLRRKLVYLILSRSCESDLQRPDPFEVAEEGANASSGRGIPARQQPSQQHTSSERTEPTAQASQTYQRIVESRAPVRMYLAGSETSSSSRKRLP